MRTPRYPVLVMLLLAIFIASCMHSPNNAVNDSGLLPSFSQDTLRLDTLYSKLSSATKRLIVYNRNNLPITLERIILVNQGDTPNFRINVDGQSGSEFRNIYIPSHDSIFIFVEATFPLEGDDLPTPYKASIEFENKAGKRYIQLEGFRLNTNHALGINISSDTTFTANRPLFIRDSLYVAPKATLTLPQGMHLLMGDKAKIVIAGTLISKGTALNRVLIEGVRRDELVPNVNYRLIPGQWEGITITSSSQNNSLSYTTIQNGRGGILLGEEKSELVPTLSLEGCVITNMKGCAISGFNAQIEATNCEFSNTLDAIIMLKGGKALFNYCTIAGFYAFDHRLMPALVVTNPLKQSLPVVQLQHSVVEGTFGVIKSSNNPATGGEILFNEKEGKNIEATACYVRAPLHYFSKTTQCLEATAEADSVFVRLGKAYKSNEYNFKYDFRPFTTAKFAGKEPNETTVITDLNGTIRKKPTTWGAYEAITKEAFEKENTNNEK